VGKRLTPEHIRMLRLLIDAFGKVAQNQAEAAPDLRELGEAMTGAGETTIGHAVIDFSEDAARFGRQAQQIAEIITGFLGIEAREDAEAWLRRQLDGLGKDAA